MMSTDQVQLDPQQDSDQLPSYQALSALAVIAVILGLVSALAILSPALWILPLAALVAAVVALRRIATADPPMVGRKAALLGLFLGVPLAAGYLTRRFGERARGRVWYEERFLPRIGPVALYGLLFTIVILFALQGDTITNQPTDVARIALPLLAYFALMWGGSFAVGRAVRLPYPRTATLAFTAAGNNFELAIAVAIGTFGVTSGQALSGVVGPLIEVPVLVGLVYVSLWLRRRFQPAGR